MANNTMADTVMADDDFTKYAYLNSPLVQAFDWIGFSALSMTTLILGMKLFNFKPPDRNCLYYFGYNERGMVSLYVNIIASTAYCAKVFAHLSGNPNPGESLVSYQYTDYMLTCPLLTIDLLWTLNLPYKITYALMVFLTLFTGYMAADHPYPGRWMWFAYGMILFTFAWLRIIGLVQVRFLQYFAKKEKNTAPTDGTESSKRMSMATKSGLREKGVRNPLQFALGTYFTIWMIYPLLWLLREGDLISATLNHCCTVIMDVMAKSLYGFALLRFQLQVDKGQVHFTELKVTKAELVEEYKDAKLKMRRIMRQQELEDENSDSDEEEDEYDDDYDNVNGAGGMGGMPGDFTPNGSMGSQMQPGQPVMSQMNSNMGSMGPVMQPMSPQRMYDENTYMPATNLASYNNRAPSPGRAPSPRLAPRGGNGGSPAAVGGWRSQQ